MFFHIVMLTFHIRRSTFDRKSSSPIILLYDCDQNVSFFSSDLFSGTGSLPCLEMLVIVVTIVMESRESLKRIPQHRSHPSQCNSVPCYNPSHTISCHLTARRIKIH